MIKVLDADFGEVLYTRIDKKVNAVKLVKIECSGDSNATRYYFHVAGMGDVLKCFSKDRRFYKTIDDCIYDTNPVDVYSVWPEDIAAQLGLNIKRWAFGGTYVEKYEWDGFAPTPFSVHLDHFWFVKDKFGWHYRCEKYPDKKLYDTREECVADNHIDVVTF